METDLDAALRVQVTNILTDVLGITRPSDVLLAEALPEVILREPQVEAVTGLSRSTIRRRIQAGTFPKPRKLGDDGKQAASGWLASEVTRWMRSLETAV